MVLGLVGGARGESSSGVGGETPASPRPLIRRVWKWKKAVRGANPSLETPGRQEGFLRAAARVRQFKFVRPSDSVLSEVRLLCEYSVCARAFFDGCIRLRTAHCTARMVFVNESSARMTDDDEPLASSGAAPQDSGFVHANDQRTSSPRGVADDACVERSAASSSTTSASGGLDDARADTSATTAPAAEDEAVSVEVTPAAEDEAMSVEVQQASPGPLGRALRQCKQYSRARKPVAPPSGSS